MTRIEDRLARPEVLLLDGGTGTELERRGVPMHELAWGGLAAFTHPETVRQVHADFIRAGAEVIITNTFSTMRYMLAAAGLGDKTREVILAAVDAARAARDEAAKDREVWIAGSISHMAPGIAPDQRPDIATAAASFREQAEILAEAGVDFIALEMIRDVAYGRAAIEAARATGLPVWVGVSCVWGKDGALVPGPDYPDDIPLGPTIESLMAAGGSLLAIMHSEIAETRAALEMVRAHWPGPLAAYAHSGQLHMPHWDFDSVIPPEAFLEEARAWIAQGARAVGGCCGMGPAHIRVLAEQLERKL